MTVYRLIPPKYLYDLKVIEAELTPDQVQEYNRQGFNCYFLPNSPSIYDPNRTINGSDIDLFNYVFVDCDLKDGTWPDKETFTNALYEQGIPCPSFVVDSGNGVHAYYQVSDLDAMSFLRLQRRLCRYFRTDEAVSKLYQLMRVPGTMNTKEQGNWKPCETTHESPAIYTCEELDKAFPPITQADEAYCKQHYDRTYGLNQKTTEVDDKIPLKFAKLLRESSEVKDIWIGGMNDRSKSDMRLGHLLYAHGFTREEAVSTLVNCAKALERAPVHRIGYAEGIVNQLWSFEEAEDKSGVNLSPSVRELLMKGDEVLKGTRFPCHRLIDDTAHGFRLGQVIGIIGGSGVGKTTLTLNAFLWFVENNPDYHHFFFSLEQPAGEIASRIKTICQGNTSSFDKIHIVSNYAEDGTFVHFSMSSIDNHLEEFETRTSLKVGAVVVDHIGVLKKDGKNGESEGLIGICRDMKPAAVRRNILLMMLSQAPREKAGIGDLELNKDAAFGTVFFEAFVDYCLCLWQPLKRVYQQGAPTVMAFKFAKIRHKKQGVDRIQEDVRYQLFFDPGTELLRELTSEEETSIPYWVQTATNLRKQDRKTDVIEYHSRHVGEEGKTG